MPELPEVETTRRILEPLVVNRRVRGMLHQDPDRYPPAGLLVGRSFLSLGRRGKYLLAPMSGGLELVVHLGMSGGFRFAPGAHTRVRLDLDERSLYFNDPRRFGRWWVVEKGQYARIPLLLRMGPEPQSGAFTKKGFTAALAGSRRRIKDLLLSQQVVAGLGNIYTDEALWVARVHPARSANRLAEGEAAGLYTALRAVLRAAVKAGGSTLGDTSYLQPDGRPGYFQLQHRVYGRVGQACLRCGAQIEKKILGGRGTQFCPHCQRL